MSDLEQTLVVRDGSRKRTFEMTEELAFEKALGDGPAVDETNASDARGLPTWMARAASSLPVPLSPVMSTVELVIATARMCSKSSSILELLPSRLSSPCLCLSWIGTPVAKERAKTMKNKATHLVFLLTSKLGPEVGNPWGRDDG